MELGAYHLGSQTQQSPTMALLELQSSILSKKTHGLSSQLKHWLSHSVVGEVLDM